MVTIFLFSALFICMFMGMPVAVALGLSSASTILIFTDDSLASLAQQFYDATNKHYTLLAIPFFVLSSAFLTTGGVALRIINFANSCVGHIRGGLAMASVMSCMIFAAVSGSSPATVAAIGSIVIAGMIKTGYPAELATGLIATSGTLGILIPPSIVMLVYATATEQSASDLFAAGLIPGLLMGFFLMVSIYVVARVKKLPAQGFAGFANLCQSFLSASGGLMLIVIVLGVIYGGLASATEAAAISAVYAYFVVVWIYRDIGPLKGIPLRLENESIGKALARNIFLSIKILPAAIFSDKDIRRTVVEACRTSLMLLFIIANAMLFAHVLTSERIPHQIAETIVQMQLSPWMFLAIVNLILLLAGAFMEPSAIVLIMAPIFLPIAQRLGIDPIHLGIVMVVNMELGLLSPPVGLNLFVASSITKKDLSWVIRAVMPWFLFMLAFLALITYVPEISTFLPEFLKSARGV